MIAAGEWGESNVREVALWMAMTRPIVMRREQSFGVSVKAERDEEDATAAHRSLTHQKRLAGS